MKWIALAMILTGCITSPRHEVRNHVVDAGECQRTGPDTLICVVGEPRPPKPPKADTLSPY
jgi:hypothetical protein